MFQSRITRCCAAVLATTSMVVVAGAAAPAYYAFLAPGVTYTLHSTVLGQMTQAAGDTGWTAHVAWAAGRGRMDIVSGGQKPMFSAGDYILFDSTTYLVVHPAAKTFSPPPDMSGKNASNEMSMMRDAMKVSDVKASIDTLEQGSTTVNGVRASHYRMRSSFTISIDFSALGAPADATPPATTSESTIDMWFADEIESVPGPFMIGRPSEMPGFLGGMKPYFDRMQALQATFPKHLVVRMSTATRIDGMANTVATNAGSDILDFKRGDVDLSRMALPADYTQATMAGLEVFGPPGPLAPEALARWRSVPKG
jgi:hypothetical protein